MSITIKLDTNSLRALIEENPEFKLDITRTVMNNIKEDAMVNAVNEKLTRLLDGVAQKHGGYGMNPTTYTWKSPEFRKLVETVIETKAVDIAQSVVSDRVESFLIAYGPKIIREQFQKIIDAELYDMITPEVVRQVLDKKLQEVLGIAPS